MNTTFLRILAVSVTPLLAAAAMPSSGLSESAAQSRSIAVEAWERTINERQPIAHVLQAMGIRPGLTIGEVGAGTGRVTVWMADAVGPQGLIYANDIDAPSLKSLEARCRKEGLANVRTILGALADPKFPARSLDIAFMTNTYHHLDKPIELVRAILPALKENGRLVIVERDKDRCPADQRDEATSPADFVKQMERAGFEVVSTDTSMRVDNIYIAKIKR